MREVYEETCLQPVLFVHPRRRHCEAPQGIVSGVLLCAEAIPVFLEESQRVQGAVFFQGDCFGAQPVVNYNATAAPRNDNRSFL